MDKQLDWCIEQIAKEAEPLITKKYTGNLKFQFNFLNGGITNINIGSDKSIKAPKLELKK